MNLRLTIQELFNTNSEYQHAQQALNLTQSLKALSDDLYTDPIRFVYELVQNADDAYDGLDIKSPLIRIDIVDQKYLIVANYGKPFDEHDIRGICCVGCGTKKNDAKKTGYKGLGFKAVFGKSDYILIASKGNLFRFDAKAKEFRWNPKWGKDQTTWEILNKQKFQYPWHICPLWTEANQLPQSVRQWLFAQPEVVATIIHLKNVSETQKVLESFVQQAHVFMFLRHIKDVHISVDPSMEIIINISQLRDGSIKISYGDKKIISHWLLHSCILNVPNEVLHDMRLPEKFQQVKTVEMTLAARIDSNDKIVPVRGSDSVLFAYLPTKISIYNLPILVNSSFLVNASREHIHTDSLWNQWLFSCIPRETFKWIQELKKIPKWSDKAYDLLPNKIPATDVLAERYNQNCLSSVNNVPFLLNIAQQSLSVRQAVVDITLFSSPDCIGHELIRDFILHTSSSKLSLPENPFVTNNHRLRNLGIIQFTWERCLEMLQSQYFSTKFTAADGIRLINYMFIHRSSTQIQKRLYELPFIMDQSKCLQRVMDIYFPSRFNSANWQMADNTDAYVHQMIMAWLMTNTSIRDWLRKLGITEKTDMTFIEEHIIPNAGAYITRANALITITRLFHLFQNGFLTTQHCQELRKLRLFTQDGSLMAADQLYFSISYLPYLPLDSFDLDDRLFLCPSYLQTIEGIQTHQWKHFFRMLGVQENLSLVSINDGHHNELVSAYISAHTANLPSYAVFYGLKNNITIQYLEHTQTNYEFAVFFWEHVIRTININHLNEPEALISSQRRIAISNLPQWCVRTRFCIPTTIVRLMPSTEVFSGNLRAIAGKYLPVFACNVRAPFPIPWQNFFGFKTELSIEDCFSLLECIYYNSLHTLLDDDEERRIQLIYATMIDRLSRMDTVHRNRARIQKPIYLLSTNENQFVLSNEIVFSIDKNITLPSQISQLRLNLENSQNARLDLLLDVMNIRKLAMNDLSLSKRVVATFSRSLRTKLRNIQPYLFALAESRTIANHCIDHDLEIFETDRVELYFNESVPICEVFVHYIHNRLYIKRPWNCPETMQSLPRILCQQFKLPPDLETDLKLMLEVESTAIIDEHFLQRNIPVQTRLYEDLSILGGKREKFAAMIDRDNTILFSNLRITNKMSAAQVLLAGLEEQDSEWAGYVYHFTHLENAVKILSDRSLKARSELSDNYFKDSAAENVIKTTRSTAKNYARFYFRPRTPTQRCNENLGSPDLIEQYGNRPMCPTPIFFRFNLRTLLAIEHLQWKVSLGNMASQHTEFDCTRDIIDRFDFEFIYADTRTERGKFSSQHEFLVEKQLNFDQFTQQDLTLICQDENARVSLRSMMTQLEYETIIDSTFFIGWNPRISIEQSHLNARRILVHNVNGAQTGEDGKLIVQIVSNNATKTITGELIGVFNRDNRLTIFGKGRITFIPETNDIQYAVFYQYKKQIWLIYTNHIDPIFTPPEAYHNET